MKVMLCGLLLLLAGCGENAMTDRMDNMFDPGSAPRHRDNYRSEQRDNYRSLPPSYSSPYRGY